VFALPFALMAAFMAARAEHGQAFAARWGFWAQLALVVVCMTAARAAAMTFNRIADRRFDSQSPRNVLRPTVTGEVSVAAAWVFYAICCLVFIAACGLFWLIWHNPWPIILALPVLAMISFYSLTKRFTWLCHVVLGAADGLAPVCAWLAVSPGTFGLPAILMGLVVTFWVGGFDIIYALPDIDIDRRLKLRSMPADFGAAGALLISRSMHVLVVLALLALWAVCRPWLHGPYLAAVGLSAIILAAEQSAVRADDFSKVNAAFFTANALVSCVLGALTILDLLI
jgi:4-hydroxybenzoate polyprenyltransferase